MSNQKTILKAAGLFSDPNFLSEVPVGALSEANNVIIDREGIIEPRRGMAQYGNSFGTLSSRSKQLLTYKNRVFLHYDDKILYNSVPHTSANNGDFLPFAGSYIETEPGLRIKYVESNKNLYFTTVDGIKKIAAKTANDFTQASNFIVDAGVFKALDLEARLNFNTEGFLPSQSKVAYRVVWGYKDINDNLLLGSASSRAVITNFSNISANVDLTFTVPQGITSAYFYQIYRTGVFTATQGLPIDQIDPGDEMNLVYEDFPSNTDITNGYVNITDVSPEDFRQNGLPLYQNPSNGGVAVANEPPPRAKDLTMYQSTVFYANTESKANLTLSLLSVEDLVSGSSQFIIRYPTGPFVFDETAYTFVGEQQISTYNYAAYAGTIPTNLNGKYFLINSAGDTRKYYVWYDNTLTTQKFDFSTYIGAIPSELDGRYSVFYTFGDRVYYFWFDATGSTQDPGLNPANTDLTGALGIRVNVSSGTTTTPNIATKLNAALVAANVYSDYDIVFTPGNSFVEIKTNAFAQDPETIETIQQGYTYSIITAANADPANTPLVNIDVVGKVGFRVSIGRGITTKAQVADATAAAILEQDSAADFIVTYTGGTQIFQLTTSNNGNTSNPSDSAINGLGSGFVVTTTQPGEGEDPVLNYVLISKAATPSQRIDETARSLVRIINRNPNEVVNAFYLSGPNDLPGQFLLQARDIGVNSFDIRADNSTTGAMFNPPLPPAGNLAKLEANAEIKPNRLFYAKLQQPEAVPVLNFIDIGPEDQPIYRILALRESLFVLKSDGVYRLTGLGGNYSVDLFDNTTKLISPDTAVVLNNQIYCLTNQGVAVITDTGVSIITKELDNIFQLITSSNYDFKYTSFGVSYETDRAYILFVPQFTNDTVATQAYRYNTATKTWTRFNMTKTCGLICPGDNKLYLGPSDENFIERERKNFNRTDYADREVALSIPSDSVDGTQIALSQVNAAVAGDALVQTQYLTLDQYNQLLRKLDLDPGIGTKESFTADYSSYSGIIPSQLHTKYFLMYSASNAQKYGIFYDAVGDVMELNTTTYPDLLGAMQIRVNISSGVTTKAQLAAATQNNIKSKTTDFVINYVPGNMFFTARTVRSGQTTDPSDSAVNGLGNGFSIVVNTQGYGDYFSSLEGVAGANLAVKLTQLANKLDADPGVANTTFLSLISAKNATGVTATSFSSTLTNIASPSHGLVDGRYVTITNSTTDPGINGYYAVDVIDANNFRIQTPIDISGTLNWSSTVTTFPEIQAAFNIIIDTINNDSGALFSNYPQSLNTFEFECLVVSTITNSNEVIVQFSLPLVVGPATLYKGIIANVTYVPEHFGDPSLLKQVSEGTFMFENSNFSVATVGYKTDLSPGIETIEFSKFGKGNWGQFVWGEQNWGGGFSGVPFRTYIPVGKQRCRYIQSYFLHNSAREKWAILGISLTLRGISQRAYR